MNDIQSERLVEMVTDALERTCFMISDPSDNDTIAGNGYTLIHGASISYSGPDSGVVYVVASDGFLEELASSLLGCEPEEIDLEVDGKDAIKELANILGGSITLELGGDRSEYLLGLPEHSDASVPESGTDIYIESMAGALRVCWVPNNTQSAQAA